MVNARVVIVSHYYPPHSGGIEVVAENQARRLAERGYNVTVVTSKTNKLERSGVVGNVRVVRVRAWNGLEKKSIPFPIFAPSIAWVLFREIKRADIVHVHDAFYISSFWAAVSARVLRKRMLLTQHVAMVPHQSLLPMLVQKSVYATSGKFIFHTSQRITTLNQRVTDFVCSRGISKNKLVWLPNGVDDTLFHPPTDHDKHDTLEEFELSDRLPIVLFVGRFVHKKGFDKVIKAESDRYQLVCVGGITGRQSSNRVKFLGLLNQNRLARLYRAADIFVLPSEGEGFPLSVQEAMASGLPVVMANDSGYMQYKLDPSRLTLLDIVTPEEIKSKLENLCDHPDQRKVMSDYSLDYARYNFSWNHIIDQLEALYTELLRVGAR